MLFRLRPGAQLFAVVAEQGDRARLGLMDPAQVIDHFLRRAERNQIPQRLAVGKDGQQVAVVLGQVIAVQLAFGRDRRS